MGVLFVHVVWKYQDLDQRGSKNMVIYVLFTDNCVSNFRLVLIFQFQNWGLTSFQAQLQCFIRFTWSYRARPWRYLVRDEKNEPLFSHQNLIFWPRSHPWPVSWRDTSVSWDRWDRLTTYFTLLWDPNLRTRDRKCFLFFRARPWAHTVFCCQLLKVDFHLILGTYTCHFQVVTLHCG